MVSERVIVVLLVLTIILSIISLTITLSTNFNVNPKTKNITIPGKTSDTQQGQVGIIIENPGNGNQ